MVDMRHLRIVRSEDEPKDCKRRGQRGGPFQDGSGVNKYSGVEEAGRVVGASAEGVGDLQFHAC